MAIPISRLTSDSSAHNTLNQPPTVPIFLQMSPDAPDGDVRGISGVIFRVMIGPMVVQWGTTPQDGRIDVQVPPGGNSTLQLQNDRGRIVAEYEITVDSGPLDPVDQVRGQQERLRMLGYQIGSSGPDGNGVNGILELDAPTNLADPNPDPNAVTAEFERSVLDFQADQGLFPDAIIGPQTQPKLTSRAKA